MDASSVYRVSLDFRIGEYQGVGCCGKPKPPLEYEVDTNLSLLPVRRSTPSRRVVSNQRLMEVVYAKLEALGGHPDVAIPDVRKISGDHITGDEAITAKRLVAILDAIESATKSVDIGS